MSLAEDFFTLFTGLMRAHGTYVLSGAKDDKGKAGGKAAVRGRLGCSFCGAEP